MTQLPDRQPAMLKLGLLRRRFVKGQHGRPTGHDINLRASAQRRKYACDSRMLNSLLFAYVGKETLDSAFSVSSHELRPFYALLTDPSCDACGCTVCLVPQWRRDGSRRDRSRSDSQPHGFRKLASQLFEAYDVHDASANYGSDVLSR